MLDTNSIVALSFAIWEPVPNIKKGTDEDTHAIIVARTTFGCQWLLSVFMSHLRGSRFALAI